MSVSQNREKRDESGKFVRGGRGGPGRRKGSSNRSSIDGRRIKQAILESWKRVDGPKILDQVAETNPVEYLKLVVKLLPQELRTDIDFNVIRLPEIDCKPLSERLQEEEPLAALESRLLEP